MTGPGPGKIRVPARVIIVAGGRARVLGEGEVAVYLHVKGWSRAPVTHVDVEAPGLEELVGGPGRGVYGAVKGVGPGFRFTPFRGDWHITVVGSLGNPVVRVLSAINTVGYAGGKRGGIYIGFRREVLRELERVAETVYGVRPRAGRR